MGVAVGGLDLPVVPDGCVLVGGVPGAREAEPVLEPAERVEGASSDADLRQSAVPALHDGEEVAEVGELGAHLGLQRGVERAVEPGRHLGRAARHHGERGEDLGGHGARGLVAVRLEDTVLDDLPEHGMGGAEVPGIDGVVEGHAGVVELELAAVAPQDVGEVLVVEEARRTPTWLDAGLVEPGVGQAAVLVDRVGPDGPLPGLGAASVAAKGAPVHGALDEVLDHLARGHVHAEVRAVGLDEVQRPRLAAEGEAGLAHEGAFGDLAGRVLAGEPDEHPAAVVHDVRPCGLERSVQGLHPSSLPVPARDAKRYSHFSGEGDTPK